MKFPDRFSVERNSPWHEGLGKSWRDIEVTVDGHRISRIVEYCVSEGWVRALVVDSEGEFVCDRVEGGDIRVKVKKIKGKVEVRRKR